MSGRVIIALALALAAAGCARPRNVRQPESFVVEVLNDNFYAARIHAVWNGANRRSLGTIDGNGGRSRATLDWEPRSLAFEVQFVTEGSSWISQSVDVSPGDSIELRIPSNIRESGFFRRVSR